MPMCRKRAAPGMRASSSWAGETDINARSIGIELVNPGHEFGYRDFPHAQIEALITLCHGILLRHPIPSARVLGHSDVAPARKEDPGELFPWDRLARAGIGLWPLSRDANLGPEALGRFGYDLGAGEEKVVTAFQRHFRPQKLDGAWDRECARLLASLLINWQLTLLFWVAGSRSAQAVLALRCPAMTSSVVSDGRVTAAQQCVEESPGSTERRCRITSGGGDPRDSATEMTPPTGLKPRQG